MEPEGSMLHKGSPIIPTLSRINPIRRIDFFEVNSNIVASHLRLGVPKCIFPVSLPVTILKTHQPSSILTTCPAHLNLLTLTVLSE